MARGYVPEMEELVKSVSFDIDHLAQILRVAGFAVDAMVETGEVRSTIVAFAARWGADLIVVGSHGRSGFDRIVMGSVSEAVGLHAKCSVEIIREHSGETR